MQGDAVSETALRERVSRETWEKFQHYERLLRQWQRKTNLVANSTLDDIWARHFTDSLQFLDLMPGATRVADIGSGGGFPGLVIAILLSEQHPQAHIHLIESVTKKCAFLRQVARGVGVADNVTVHDERAESVLPSLDDLDVLTARALAPLSVLFDLGESVLSRGTIGVFAKGRDHRLEIDMAAKDWHFDCEVTPSRTENGSVLLRVSNVRRKD